MGNLRAAQVTLGEQTDSDQALVPSDEHKGAQGTEQRQTERASQRVDCKMDELKKIRYMGVSLIYRPWQCGNWMTKTEQHVDD